MEFDLIAAAKRDGVVRINVAAVIATGEDKVLFCQRSLTKSVAPGRWHMPGGAIENGETAREAIVRELDEELGLQVISVAGYTGIKHDYTVCGDLHRTHFLYAVAVGQIRLNSENGRAGLFAFDNLPEILEPDVLEYNVAAFRHALTHRTRSSIVLPADG